MPVLAAVTVLLFGAGVLLFAVGWVGTVEAEGSSRSVPAVSVRLKRQVAVAVGAGLVAGLVTRWVGLFFAVGGVVFMLQGLFADRKARVEARDRLRAVSAWLEMLRDTVAGSGSGIARAVVMTSSRAPTAIAPEVRRLAVRMDSSRLEEALWRFGEDLDVPAADTAIAALVLAAGERGAHLTQLLSTVISATRKRVEQDDRMEAHRAKFATSALMMVVVTGLTSLVIIGGSARFRATYSTAMGQVVLMVAGTVFMLAIAVLRWMGRPSVTMRLVRAPV